MPCSVFARKRTGIWQSKRESQLLKGGIEYNNLITRSTCIQIDDVNVFLVFFVFGLFFSNKIKQNEILKKSVTIVGLGEQVSLDKKKQIVVFSFVPMNSIFFYKDKNPKRKPIQRINKVFSPISGFLLNIRLEYILKNIIYEAIDKKGEEWT